MILWWNAVVGIRFAWRCLRCSADSTKLSKAYFSYLLAPLDFLFLYQFALTMSYSDLVVGYALTRGFGGTLCHQNGTSVLPVLLGWV